jgi:hypothetical protein
VPLSHYISNVSLRCQGQGSLVLYLAAGVVEEWLSEGFGTGRCIVTISRSVDLLSLKHDAGAK